MPGDQKTSEMHSTVASIQNIRKQRQLELELVELDRKWHVELKIIARERLGLVKELCKFNQELRHLDHFNENMHGKDITRFADRAQGRQMQEKESKLLKKYDFEPDPVEKVSLNSLPLLGRENHDDSLDGGASSEDFGLGHVDLGGHNGHSGGRSHGSQHSPDHGGFGEDVGKILTSKDLTKQRIQLQKINTEKAIADRRNKRRAFWDKSIIGTRKTNLAAKNRERNGLFGNGKPFGNGSPSSSGVNGGYSAESPQEEPKKVRANGPYKSPSLPALNNLHKIDSVKVNRHPSLSNKHSASMDYLPVIRGSRPTYGLFSPNKSSPLSSGSTLPTINEV